MLGDCVQHLQEDVQRWSGRFASVSGICRPSCRQV